MSSTTPEVLLLAKHTKLMSNQFVISIYQNKPIWSKAVAEEMSYLLLVSYVNLMQSNGVDSHKKSMIDRVVDEWTGVMTGFLNAKNTPQARMTIKQRFNEKSAKYTSVIENMLGERLDSNPDDEIAYKYELYELFLKEMLDNYNDRVCQKPSDGMVGAMNFINASQDLEVIREEIFNEKSVIMLSLQYEDVDDITEHDKIAINKNQNKKDIRKRALVIRDGVVNFLTECVYSDLQNNNKNYQLQNDDVSQSIHTSYKPSFWSLHGRMRRTTYIILSIPTIFILMIVRIGVQGGIDLSPSFEYLLLATVIELVPWSFLAFIGAKRLHDCNYKAWWIVIPMVAIAMWFWKPTQGVNRFGADPRDDYFDDEIEIEKDYSIWIGVAIFLFYNLVLSPKMIDEQQKYENRQNNTPTHQDNQSSNVQTPNISPSDIVTPNTNNEPQLTPQIVLAEAQKRYDNTVHNINGIWNSLHPSVQEFLRNEQRVINKKREADCMAYGNSQSSDKDLAKAYRYLCEIPQLNERAEYLKTQLNTVVTPPIPNNVEPAYYQKQNQNGQSNQNGYNLKGLINDTVKKSLLFLDRDSASYDGYSHKLESQDITYADINNDSIKDAVVALRYCEVLNCHTTTKSSELVVYIGTGNNQYLYGDIKTLGIDLAIYVDTFKNIYTQSKYYSEHEDPTCCPSMVVDQGFSFKNGKLIEMD